MCTSMHTHMHTFVHTATVGAVGLQQLPARAAEERADSAQWLGGTDRWGAEVLRDSLDKGIHHKPCSRSCLQIGVVSMS